MKPIDFGYEFYYHNVCGHSCHWHGNQRDRRSWVRIL